METTLELYRRAKIAAGVQSDYAMAKVLGVKANTCSNYVTGKARFDDEVAAKVADLLGIEAGYVIACANAERAKTDKGRAIWARIAALLIAISPAGPASGVPLSSDLPSANYQKLTRVIRRLTGADFQML